MKDRVQQLADEVVTDVTDKGFCSTHERVQKEMHGESCGCDNCKKYAVAEFNSWVIWAAGDKFDPEPYLYGLEVVNGKLTITPPWIQSEGNG